LPRLLKRGTKMRELRRWMVERLFERELDEDYNMGIRYGQSQAKKAALAKIENAGIITAKKNHAGLALALKAVK